jgi:hypothetical protein
VLEVVRHIVLGELGAGLGVRGGMGGSTICSNGGAVYRKLEEVFIAFAACRV